MTDSLGDLLIRLKNAQTVRKEAVTIPASRLKADVLLILKDEGFVRDIELLEGEAPPCLEVRLHYFNRFRGAIQGATRVSRPGRRVYMGSEELKKWIGKRAGVWVLSTSKGVISHAHAFEQKVGGEVLLHIW